MMNRLPLFVAHFVRLRSPSAHLFKYRLRAARLVFCVIIQKLKVVAWSLELT